MLCKCVAAQENDIVSARAVSYCPNSTTAQRDGIERSPHRPFVVAPWTTSVALNKSVGLVIWQPLLSGIICVPEHSILTHVLAAVQRSCAVLTSSNRIFTLRHGVVHPPFDMR
jgi:hypothetical protein